MIEPSWVSELLKVVAKEPGKWLKTFASKAGLNLLGLVLTLVGGILLASAVNLEPTHFKLVEDPAVGYPDDPKAKAFAICHDDEKVVAGYGGPLRGYGACPAQELKNTGPTPQLVADHPSFLRVGVWLIILGFVFQVPSAWVTLKGTTGEGRG